MRQIGCSEENENKIGMKIFNYAADWASNRAPQLLERVSG